MNTTRLIDLARAMKPATFPGRCFHVTYALQGSRVLAVGVNQPGKTHPRIRRLPYRKPDCIGIHSELACVMRLGEDADFQRVTFFNVRIDRNGSPNLAKPCQGCAALLKQTGYRRVIFTTKDGIEQL